MTKLFNTPHEMSLRLIIFLSQHENEYFTAEHLAITDFLITYGASFGIADVNLHGNNRFKFSEYSNRRNLAFDALKSLTLKGFATVQSSDEGFSYTVSKEGMRYANAFESNYSNALREMSHKAYEFTLAKSEKDMLNTIHRQALKSLSHGGEFQ